MAGTVKNFDRKARGGNVERLSGARQRSQLPLGREKVTIRIHKHPEIQQKLRPSGFERLLVHFALLPMHIGGRYDDAEAEVRFYTLELHLYMH